MGWRATAAAKIAWCIAATNRQRRWDYNRSAGTLGKRLNSTLVRSRSLLASADPDVSESYSATDEELTQAITRAQENVLRQQKPDGHWCGELIVDSTLCSDCVVFMHWCGEVDAQLQRRCIRHILRRQLPDGGWNIYHGGPSEINASVKAYFALKLAGCSV